MKKITLMLFGFWMAASACAGGSAWLTNLPEAADQATKEKKLLLLDFTGSDWCGWCMKLDEETFSRAEFLDYAAKNVVLVKVDFPKHKPQSDDEKQANRALKKQYGVEGFPTVLIIKPDWKVLLEQRGYAEGGPNVMIAAVNQCRRAAGLGGPVESATTATAAPAKPTAPVAAAPTPSPQKNSDEPKLQGILYSATHSYAVLGGKTCEEGETVHGFRVVKIARDNVTVEYQGQTKVLQMH